jgi:heavy metal sensor kinase
LESSRIIAVARRYEQVDVNGFYIVIWMSDSSTPGYKSASHPGNVARPSIAERDTGIYTQTAEDYREVYHATEHGDCILMARPLSAALAEAHQFGALFGLGSVVVLALGLGGEWLIVTRALRPVAKISAAAEKISSGDLSQRINVAETDSELGQLATVLNSTFARLEAVFVHQQQFTSDAAHELRTPVSVLLTHAQNGLASGCASEEHREAFEACQRAAYRMRTLISALLALAQLDDGSSRARRTNFDLARTVRECAELLQPLADERGVKILAEPAPLQAYGDAEQLAQAITNLMGNAIQYNRPNGEVRVTLEARGPEVVLRVQDTGVGIAATDLPRVFERFFRADKSRTSGGLGLGLAITKTIVAAHGGTIEVSSNVNFGTTFTIILPQGATVPSQVQAA